MKGLPPKDKAGDTSFHDSKYLFLSTKTRDKGLDFHLPHCLVLLHWPSCLTSSIFSFHICLFNRLIIKSHFRFTMTVACKLAVSYAMILIKESFPKN